MKKVYMTIMIVLISLSLIACQKENIWIGVMSNDTSKGIVDIPDHDTHKKGEIIELKAIPYKGYEFIGWYLDDEVLLSEDEMYLHEVNESTYIFARFDEPIHVLTIESVQFYAQYDNENNDLFQIKTANIEFSVIDIDGKSLTHPTVWVNIEYDEPSWISTANHQRSLVASYIPDSPLSYEVRNTELNFYAQQSWGFHIQEVTDEHYSSNYVSYSRVPYTLELSLTKTTISIEVYQASYATLTMEITYTFMPKQHLNY